MQYPQRIIEERKRQGITQEQLAELWNTTRQQVSKYETSMQELPLRRFLEVADLLGVSLDYLAGRSDCRSIAEPLTGPENHSF